MESRRVLIERYGIEKFVRDIGGVTGKTYVKVQKRGTLYTTVLPGDEPIVIIRVKNSTPEPDGSTKEYWLRVPPWIQTVDAGLAWGFDLTDGKYNPKIET